MPVWKRPIHTGLPACPFAHKASTEHPKPLRRSRRRGAAWRKQGLDCLSASELSSPPPSTPRQGVFCAWSRIYSLRSHCVPLLKQRSKSFGFCFADFLWRGKESQRGALPLSATASSEVLWVEVSAQAVAILVFLVLGHLRTPQNPCKTDQKT